MGLKIIKEKHHFKQDHTMICASAGAESNTYKKVEGKSGNTWYVPSDLNPNVQVDTHDPNSEGYRGRTLEFILEDGTIDKVQGPWSSNSDALFRDTGIDLRNNHITYGIIAGGRSPNHEDPYNLMNHIYIDVVHLDEKPTKGEYSRIQNLAQKLADEYKLDLFYQVKSGGGGCAGLAKYNRDSEEK